MHSAPAEATQSWFVAKAAVALSPILILLTADVIGRLVRRTLWRCTWVAPRSGRETARHEPAGVAALRGRGPGRVADRRGVR